MKRKSFIIILAVAFMFSLSAIPVLAQEIDYCKGNFDYDKDVDGSDASTFKSDYGRSGLSNPCPLDGPVPVLKTGQTVSYEPGDDGDLEKGVASPNPRFTDNGDGTVTDNLTGLIWLKNANCMRFFITDPGPNERRWQYAIWAANALQSGYCGLTDNSSAGDWRLPNKRELLSLIDDGRSLPALPVGHPFVGVQWYYYWSSTTYASYELYAWYVPMGSGDAIGNGNKLSDLYCVWPVRGGR